MRNVGEGIAKIVSAEFIASVFDSRELSKFTLPQVAFVGRSNVGKSTLINALCERKALAKTSSTPGKTQSINFYQIEFLLDDKKHFLHLVDLPGFGFAKVSKGERNSWSKLIESYLESNNNLQALVLLMDCRREVEQEELWFFDYCKSIELLFVLTKVDKLSTSQLKQKQRQVLQILSLSEKDLFVSGSSSVGKSGVEFLRIMLLEYCNNNK